MRQICKKAVIVTVVMICAVVGANAQSALYAGFGGGVSLVKDMASPVFSVRLGMDEGFVLAEVEGSYLSIKSENKHGDDMLSTMTVGVNVGLKFLSGYHGYMAVMLNTGYALQEGLDYGDCYDPYRGHGYGHHRYCGKYYIGAGVKGNVFICDRISLFGEARYQSIPIDGGGRNKWGAIFQGGINFYF